MAERGKELEMASKGAKVVMALTHPLLGDHQAIHSLKHVGVLRRISVDFGRPVLVCTEEGVDQGCLYKKAQCHSTHKNSIQVDL